ncbi:RNA-directed DNA polymerase protein [Dioscorea alata]|uniref:RNA-directed DNA polymerase protein n=1 Tax=Dioscorea alata TaxID=55571 RepID=A0ACB7WKZ7_DIOAL|nr:RNA-directed DNA polymerase protein [Dioscorea alata]
MCKTEQQKTRVAEEVEEEEEMMFMAITDHKPEGSYKKSWLLDSGCTHHMCGDIKSFKELDWSYRSKVKIGNGEHVNVEGKGEVFINTLQGNTQLNNVLFVPAISHNLMSVGQLIENGLALSFHDKLCEVFDKKGEKLMEVEMHGHSFPVNLEKEATYYAGMDETQLWHKRYGHCNFETLKQMADVQMVIDMPLVNSRRGVCSVCEEGKSHRQPFPT